MSQESISLRQQTISNIKKLESTLKRVSETSELLSFNPAPCWNCEKSCWDVAYKGSKQLDRQTVKGDYETRCFCLVQHKLLESLPVLCDGNPDYFPDTDTLR